MRDLSTVTQEWRYRERDRLRERQAGRERNRHTKYDPKDAFSRLSGPETQLFSSTAMLHSSPCLPNSTLSNTVQWSPSPNDVDGEDEDVVADSWTGVAQWTYYIYLV